MIRATRPWYRQTLLTFTAVLWLGCNAHRVSETDREEYRFDASAETTRVSIRIDDGSVVVIGRDESGSSAGDDVAIRIEKRARAVDRDTALELLRSFDTTAAEDDGTIRVRALSSGLGATLRGSLSANVEMRLPRRCALDIRTSDGRIELESLEGDIVAETGDGRLRLRDVTGDVRLRTSDGSIEGSRLGGRFDVSTNDGRVELDGAFTRIRAVTGDGSIRIASTESSPSSEEWDIRTSDGSVELRLPETISAELELSTNDGSIHNHFDAFVGDVRTGRVRGTLGDGGPLILVTTMDGSITLEPL